ncbi:hypothetical protein D3OALGB2SA_1783 [Olavius algarvensis associated proteobacterium Delta 3]|nr:hypothetical protein D3OALGB2SA_1783 [Olavius algarvensis associated proteobacterium Delta 3]
MRPANGPTGQTGQTGKPITPDAGCWFLDAGFWILGEMKAES